MSVHHKALSVNLS